MTGGTTNHNEITGKFYAHFKLQMRVKNYKVDMGDVKLWILRCPIYTYPDIMVI
jgi:hypothetical protein